MGNGSRFFQIIAQAERAALSEGDFQKAVDLCVDAEAFANECGDQELADRAFCNRCGYLIELDAADSHLTRLKEVILRTGDQCTSWLANFYTAQIFYFDDAIEKAWAYADRASSIAIEMDDPVRVAHSTNLAGTLSLQRSLFTQAEGYYSQALQMLEQLDGYNRIYYSLAKDNLGYVMMCTGRVDEGVQLCEQALSELDQKPGRFSLHEVLQDLCYGHLLLDNFDRANECGKRALSLAEEQNDVLIQKNCLFLLAEIETRSGRPFLARQYIRRLTTHYSGLELDEEIIDVFLATDLTTVVNLRG